MKKTLSILILLVAMSSVTFARRADKPAPVSGVAVVKSGSTYKLFYKGSSLTDVKISILDASDNVVFSETIRKVDAFVRPYNFSGLKDGDYTVEVIDGSALQVRKVNYHEGKFEKVVGFVKLKGEEQKFLVTIPNKGKETIDVRVINDDGKVLYAAREQVEGDFAKIYNLKSIDGKGYFEITDKEGHIKIIRY